MKKLLVGALVSIGLLAGCGAEKPTDTVDEFLTAFQKSDFEKAGKQIDEGLEELQSEEESMSSEKFLKAIGKDYGKDLYHTIIFLLGLLVILWYLKV